MKFFIKINTLILIALFSVAGFAQNSSGINGSDVEPDEDSSGLIGEDTLSSSNSSGLNGGNVLPSGNSSGLNGGNIQTTGNSSGISASGVGKPTLSVSGIAIWIVQILNQIVVAIMAASLVVFLYGIFKLSFLDGANPESIAKSRKFMFWGIISLFVMVSVWGIVQLLKSSVFGSGPLIGPSFK